MKLKEPMNGFLHLIGALGAIAALVVLLVLGHDSPWKVVSFSIYGFSLIMLFSASTLYHWLPKEAGGKGQVFRKIDHLSIYLLIAGSYTPFCLVPLNGAWGWTIFGIVWGLALLGMSIQAFYINVPRWITTTVYCVMGWVIVIATKPLLAVLPINGFWYLLGGGIVYSIGGVVYTIKKPNLSKNFGYHELWHVFVLGGAFCHFLAVLFYIVPYKI